VAAAAGGSSCKVGLCCLANKVRRKIERDDDELRSSLS
jgi:hypothetical protein